MPRTKVDFDDVRRIGLRLPEVEEGKIYGTPALKVRGKMFTCIPNHRSAEPGSLAVRIDFSRRAELLAADPKTYYLTYHYEDYPCVLVRLSRIHPDALKDLLTAAWRFVGVNRRTAGRKIARRKAN